MCASVFCAGVLLLPLAGQAAEDNKSQLKDIQQSIAEKESGEAAATAAQLAAGSAASAGKTIAQASRQLRDTQGTLTQLGKDISGLNASIAKLQKQQSAQQNLLAKQLDAAFRQGQHSAVQLILSGEESQRSERILAYFGYLNEARQKTIEELKQTRAELAKQNHAGGQTGPAKSLLGEQQTQQQSWSRRAAPAKR